MLAYALIRADAITPYCSEFVLIASLYRHYATVSGLHAVLSGRVSIEQVFHANRRARFGAPDCIAAAIAAFASCVLASTVPEALR